MLRKKIEWATTKILPPMTRAIYHVTMYSRATPAAV